MRISNGLTVEASDRAVSVSWLTVSRQCVASNSGIGACQSSISRLRAYEYGVTYLIEFPALRAFSDRKIQKHLTWWGRGEDPYSRNPGTAISHVFFRRGKTQIA